MMNRFKLYIKIAFLVLVTAFTSCELDERLDDLTGGFRGSFIDKDSPTNEVVYTEYYGSKLRLLDLGFGDIAQPSNEDFYNALPDGTFSNDKIFPATYKIWADGPFLELDTIQSLDLTNVKIFDIKVVPNVSLKIEEIVNVFGIGMEITYSYKVNDSLSENQQIGFIYSVQEYPGFNSSALQGENETALATRMVHDLTEIEGTITDFLFLEPNKAYYVRALGKFEGSSDFWNYSAQEEFSTSNLDVAAIPLEVEVGARSSSSVVFQVELPELEGLNYKVEYTDMDGNNISEVLTGLDYSYAANLPENTTTNVNVFLTDGVSTGNPATVAVTTKMATERYIGGDPERPPHIPRYHDTDFKYSLSKYVAEDLGPSIDPAWVTSTLRHEFIDWWSTWLFAFGSGNLPTSEYLANISSFTMYGNVTTIIDILPFTGLETLTINVGEDLFSTGLTVSNELNLEPLAKLSNLTTVIIGEGVPLTEADFIEAGLSNLTIIEN